MFMVCVLFCSIVGGGFRKECDVIGRCAWTDCDIINFFVLDFLWKFEMVVVI